MCLIIFIGERFKCLSYFRMGVSTIRQFVPETCSVIYQVLKGKYMTVSTITFFCWVFKVCNSVYIIIDSCYLVPRNNGRVNAGSRWISGSVEPACASACRWMCLRGFLECCPPVTTCIGKRIRFLKSCWWHSHCRSRWSRPRHSAKSGGIHGVLN